MDYIEMQNCLKEWLDDEYNYWTHEGMIFRMKNTLRNDESVEALGPGGWTEVL